MDRLTVKSLRSARAPRRQPRGPASPRALAAATTAVVLVGIAAAVLVIGEHETVHVPSSAERAIVIGLVLVLLHVRPSRSVAARGNMETINLDEVLFVPIVIMLQPAHGIVTVAAASLGASMVLRRSLLKTAFNIGQLTIATSVGIAVVALLGFQPSEEPRAGTVIAGMVGALAMTGVTALVVRCMVAFATGLPVGPLLRDIRSSVVPWTGALTLGAVGVIAVVAYLPSVVLVVVLVLFVQRAYAATFRELAARRLAERVQDAVSSLRSHSDPALVRTHLVAAACDLLGAGRAEIVEGDEVSTLPDALSASLGSGLHLVVDDRQGPGTWTDQNRATLDTLAGVAADVLRSAEVIARLRTITNSQTEGVIALDTTGQVTFLNPAARRMMSLNGDTPPDRHVDKLFTLHERDLDIDLVTMIANRHVAHDDDATLVSSDGVRLEVAYSLTPLEVEQVHVGAVLVLRDVTERRAFDRVLAHRALHDDLTGLPNRALLQERLDHALERSRESGTQHGLLFIDLDRFKLVNDSYGHLAGDKLLVTIGLRLRANLTARASLARLSGDEFVVLIEDVSGLAQVIDVAEHVLGVMREPLDLDGHPIYMSASIGVVLTHRGQRRDDALAAADAAAYAAKAAGRGCYRVSERDSFQVARTRLDLEARMHHGLENEHFLMLFQPIVDTETVEVVGAEALVRWNDPERGMIGPADFISLAEETGLIIPLGRWVLRESCRTVQEWTVQHPDRTPLSISVNLSAVQFGQPNLAEEVSDILAETGLAPSQLCVEITESVLMNDASSTIATLDTLRALGIRVAIDDFGTGYSSLSYLKRFPIDVVKLDGSFIRGLNIDAADTEIVSAVVRLSTALGLRTVAECVEEESQRLALVAMGCSLVQGYLVARPLRPEAFVDFWLRGAPPAPPASAPPSVPPAPPVPPPVSPDSSVEPPHPAAGSLELVGGRPVVS